jgi:hypothetical protein
MDVRERPLVTFFGEAKKVTRQEAKWYLKINGELNQYQMRWNFYKKITIMFEHIATRL